MKKIKAIILALLFIPAMFLFASCDEKITEIRVSNYKQEFQLYEDYTFGNNFLLEKKVGKDWKAVLIEDVEIVESNFDPEVAGTYTIKVKIKDFDQIVTISVTVNKSTPAFEEIEPLNAVFGQTLADISLPAGYTWEDSSLSVGDATDQNGRAFNVVLNKGESYLPVVGSVKVIVAKQTVLFAPISNITAVYEQNLTDLTLPDGYSWVNKNQSVGDFTEIGRDFEVVYNKGNNYNPVNGTVKVFVNKKESTINPYCNVNGLHYGDDMPFLNKEIGDTQGEVVWVETALVTGINEYNWTFTPTNSNYTSKTGKISINVAKKQLAIPQVPSEGYTYNGQTQSLALTNPSDKWTMTGQTTAKNYGSYQVTVALVDKTNYEWAGGVSFNLTKNWSIKKADITNYTVPTLGTIKQGDELNKITVTGGIAKDFDETQIEGTFAFVNPSYIPSSVNDNVVKMKFTHTNTNFNQLQFDVTISIIYFDAQDKTYNYDGQSHNIEFTGLLGTETVEYSDSEQGPWVSNFGKTNAGEYTVFYKVTYGNQLTFVSSATLTINTISIETAVVTLESDSVKYTGSPVSVVVTSVKVGTVDILPADYTITYENNTNVGTATAILTGKNNTTGEVRKTFDISNLSLTGAIVTLQSEEYDFTGSAITVTITSVNAGGTLVFDTDFVISYENNINAGTATVILTGKNNASGTVRKDFTIKPLSLETAVVTLENNSLDFTGIALTPAVTSVKVGNVTLTANDYTIGYESNTNAGTAKVVLTGKNNASNTVKKDFIINALSLASAVVALESEQISYTGSPVSVEISSVVVESINLTSNDYTISYENNINVGTATVVLTGKNNATGTVRKNFEILSSSINSAVITLVTNEYDYTGAEISVVISSVMVGDTTISSTNYSISYENNINVGTATVVLTGKNLYSGTARKDFTIKSVSLLGSVVTLQENEFDYTSKEISVVVNSVVKGITSFKTTDYTISYQNNINAGNATVILTGKNNATGEVRQTFVINPISLSTAVVELENDKIAYSGMQTEVTIKTVKVGTIYIVGDDYTISYENNTELGTATAILTGKNNATGTVRKTYTIQKMVCAVYLDLVTSYWFYSNEEPEYEFVVKVAYENFLNEIEVTEGYELKTKDGQDLDFTLFDDEQKLYATYEGVVSSNYLSVYIIEYKISSIDVDSNNFKKIYSVNAPLDSYANLVVTGEYTDNATEILEYSATKQEGCYYVTTNFNSAVEGTYYVTITSWDNGELGDEFNIFVQQSQVITGISRLEFVNDIIFVGTELNEIELNVYVYYNNNYDVEVLYDTITLDDERISFRNNYDIMKIEAQEFTFSFTPDEEEFSLSENLYLNIPQIYSIKLDIGGNIYLPDTIYIMPLLTDYSTFNVIGLYEDGTEMVLDASMYDSFILESVNNTTEGYLNNVYVYIYTQDGLAKNFKFKNQILPANVNINSVLVNGEEIELVNNKASVFLDEFTSNIDFHILLEKQTANVIIKIYGGNQYLTYFGEDSGRGIIDYRFELGENLDFSRYKANVTISDGLEIKTFDIYFERENFVEKVELNGIEVHICDLDYILVGSELKITPKESYTVRLNNEEVDTITVSNNIDSIDIEIINNDDNVVFDYNYSNIRRISIIDEISVNGVSQEVAYLGERLDFDVDFFASNIEIDSSSIISENLELVYMVENSDHEIIVPKTVFKEFPLAVPQNSLYVTIYYKDVAYYNTAVSLTLNKKSYIDKFIIHYPNNSLQYYDCFTDQEMNYTLDMSVIEEFEVKFINGYSAYSAKVVDENGEDFDFSNLKLSNDLYVEIYDTNNKLVQKSKINLSFGFSIGFYNQTTLSDSMCDVNNEREMTIFASTGDIINFYVYSDITLKVFDEDNNQLPESAFTFAYGRKLLRFELTFRHNEKEETLSFEKYVYMSSNRAEDFISGFEIQNDECYVDIIAHNISYPNYLDISSILSLQNVTLRDDSNTYEYTLYLEQGYVKYVIKDSEQNVLGTIFFSLEEKCNFKNNADISYFEYETMSDVQILSFEDNSYTFETILQKNEIRFYSCDPRAELTLRFGEEVKSNKSSLNYVVSQTGTYYLTVTAEDKTEKVYTIIVNNIDKTPVLKLTLGDDVYILEMREGSDYPVGDFTMLPMGEDVVSYIKYLGNLSQYTTFLPVKIESCFGNSFVDNNYEEFEDYDNIQLEILTDDDSNRYAIFYFKMETNDETIYFPIYLYLYEKDSDITFKLGSASFNFIFDYSLGDFGDFELNNQLYFIYCNTTREEIGLSESATNVDMLVLVNNPNIDVHYGPVTISQTQPMTNVSIPLVTDEMGTYVNCTFTYNGMEGVENISIYLFITD